jgi:hypothetical protein
MATVNNYMNTQKKYGWYSHKQEVDYGFSYKCTTTCGEIVYVTAFSNSGSKKPTDYYNDMYMVNIIDNVGDKIPNSFLAYMGYKTGKIFQSFCPKME